MTDISKATLDVDATHYVRRVLQAVSDISQRRFNNCRVADLGCAHGGYTNELARQGAIAVGIEGRATWLEHAEAIKAAHGLNTAFYQDDVRNFTREKYGTFDIVLCLGLLYHMDSIDLVPLLRNICECCSYYTVIQTHISLEPQERLEVEGKVYWGRWSKEHDPSDSEDKKLTSLGSSLDNNRAFWLTRASLLNMLRYVGFTTVLECLNPLANVYYDGAFRFFPDHIALVAFKGQAVGGAFGMTSDRPEEDWPEDLSPYFIRNG